MLAGAGVLPGFPLAHSKSCGRVAEVRTLRGWAISTLQEAGAIREREYHGWLIVRRSARARAGSGDARQDVPANISLHRAITETLDVLDGIGDMCPNCPSD